MYQGGQKSIELVNIQMFSGPHFALYDDWWKHSTQRSTQRSFRSLRAMLISYKINLIFFM